MKKETKEITEEEVQAVANAIVEEAEEQNKNVEEVVNDIVEESVEETEKPTIKETKEVDEFYIMRQGETLKDVAKKFKLDEKKLKKLNGEVFGTNQIRLK